MSAYWAAGVAGILVYTDEKKGERLGFRTPKIETTSFFILFD